MKKHYRNDNNCLNCGTILSGKFCHNCGQENLEIKESFGHMVNHAVSDYFHFDHQFFHTLVPLFLKPGKLTNEYMAGKRVQYLHPVKMYIFISLVFFFLYFQRDANEKKEVEHKKANTEKASEIRDSVKSAVDSVKNALAAVPALTKDEKARIETKIKERNKLHVRTKTYDADDENGSVFYSDYDREHVKTYDQYLVQQAKLPENDRDNFIEQFIVKKNIEWKEQGKTGEQIKEAFFEAFKHNIPKLMFVLLPFFALMFRIAFYKNSKYYVEHLIFTIHIHCFLFLLLAITLLIKLILPETWTTVNNIIGVVGTLAVILYMYRALKAVYNRSRFRTITKMIGMSWVYFFIVVLGFMGLLTITALTAV